MTTTRRGFVKTVGLAATGLAGGLAVAAEAGEQTESGQGKFRFCLNMSTIRGQNLSADEEIRVAQEAGYDAIEPWLGKLHDFARQGGSLADLRKRLDDGGTRVESAIGFAPWIVDDDQRRAEGLEQARRDMDVVAKLGGIRIAASPAGVPRGKAVDPRRAAERYRKLLEIGDQMGVTPQVEMWGGNPSIGRLSTAVAIAIESGHPKACFLGDVYHIYKGGCDFDGLRLLGPEAMQVFHMNDYPAEPPRETIRDEHRVFPGDGVAPIGEILQIFRQVRAYPVLSLELFNRQYWKRPALEVARTGLRKMKQAVA